VRVVVTSLGLIALPLEVFGMFAPGQAMAPTLLRPALTPSQSPTSLQESGEEFAQVLTNWWECPRRSILPPIMPAPSRRCGPRAWIFLCSSRRGRVSLTRGRVPDYRPGHVGRAHRAAARAGPGGLVQWRHPALAQTERLATAVSGIVDATDVATTVP
jgi:hypothetical protein